MIPLYFLGARLLEAYPFVPMMANQAVCVAALSYAGGLHWGFNADWDALPDLHDFVESFDPAFAELTQLAGRTRRRRPDSARASRGRSRPAEARKRTSVRKP